MKKQKKYIIYSTIIVLFTALFYACKTDIENAVASISGSPDNAVLEAQAWYNSTRKDTLSLGFVRVKSTKRNMNAKPDWKHTYTIQEKDYTAVHVQLSTKGIFSFVTPENKQAYEATGDQRYLKTFTRMVVLTDKKSKKTTGFLMTLVPDKAYFESTHFDALRSNYRQWQKGYSGYVFYHTLDGKFNNAWKFENGKVTKKVTQTSNDGIDVSMDAKKKITAEENCLYTYIDIWSQVCINYYSNSEYLDKICGDWYYDYTIVITECYDTDNTGGTSEDKNNGDSGGGGGVSTDCAGVVGGIAYLDSCQECVGGTTGKVACVKDCAGVYGGTAYLDSCKECVGGTTGKVECTECEQLNNELAALTTEYFSTQMAVKSNIVEYKSSGCGTKSGQILRNGKIANWSDVITGETNNIGQTTTVTKSIISANNILAYFDLQEAKYNNFATAGGLLGNATPAIMDAFIAKLASFISKYASLAVTCALTAKQINASNIKDKYEAIYKKYVNSGLSNGLYMIESRFRLTSTSYPGGVEVVNQEFYDENGCPFDNISFIE